MAGTAGTLGGVYMEWEPPVYARTPALQVGDMVKPYQSMHPEIREELAEVRALSGEGRAGIYFLDPGVQQHAEYKSWMQTDRAYFNGQRLYPIEVVKLKKVTE